MRDDIEKLAERFGVPQDWIKILLIKENKIETKEVQPAISKPYIFDRVKFVSELLQEHGQSIGELLSSPPETMAEFAACLAEAAHFHENMGEALRQIAQIAIIYDDIHCHCGEDGFAKVNGKVLCPNHYEASMCGTHFDAEVEALPRTS